MEEELISHYKSSLLKEIFSALTEDFRDVQLGTCMFNITVA